MASYVLNEGKMFSDVADGIAIVINSETGIYYGMNGFGTQVFDNITSGVSFEAILAELNNMPGVPEDIQNRLNTFIENLVRYEIIVAGDAAVSDVADLEVAVAQADEFVLSVQEFDDAQELLLADPIHEVKEETGWQPDKDALETDAEVVAAKEAKIQH